MGQGVRTPHWKVIKIKGFLAILVQIPWKITQLPSQHSMLGHHLPGIIGTLIDVIGYFQPLINLEKKSLSGLDHSDKTYWIPALHVFLSKILGCCSRGRVKGIKVSQGSSWGHGWGTDSTTTAISTDITCYIRRETFNNHISCSCWPSSCLAKCRKR